MLCTQEIEEVDTNENYEPKSSIRFIKVSIRQKIWMLPCSIKSILAVFSPFQITHRDYSALWNSYLESSMEDKNQDLLVLHVMADKEEPNTSFHELASEAW